MSASSVEHIDEEVRREGSDLKMYDEMKVIIRWNLMK